MSADLHITEHGRALDAATFADAMAGFGLTPGARIAVGVSGGGDSMALVRLMADWAGARQIDIKAVTVDHRLRAEAAAEARQVTAWLEPLAIPHSVIAWEDGARETRDRSPQKAARDARYGLMAAWCAGEGRSHLFLAHHADDQVETFLIRLTRGSGVSGLAAMAPLAALNTVHGPILLARPLLGFAKADLAAVCRDFGQPWIEDPSNANAASTRVRFRQAARLLEEEGLTRARLLETVGHLQRAREALDQAAVHLIRTATAWDHFGAVRLGLKAWCAAPEEVALRALSRLLTAASGHVYGPRFESLTRLARQMRSGPWRDATLHGCFIAREGDCIVIHREAAQVNHTCAVNAGETIIWDGRFRIRMPENSSGGPFRIAPWTVEELPSAQASQGADVPRRLRATLPAVYDSVGLAYVPHAGFARDDLAANGAQAPEVACIPALSLAAGPQPLEESAIS
ncbi:MAG: tRNA lysidine(34) synthetase TilS [Rhodospirillaceae bacterium]